MKECLLACLVLQFSALAHAAAPAAVKPMRPKQVSAVTGVSDAERYSRRCQSSQSALRIARPQGSMLWGTKRDWDTEKVADERRSVLVSVDLAPPRHTNAQVKALRLEGGHLVAVPSTGGVVGTVLQGTASDGKPVEVAICGAEPSPEDSSMVWYRIEAWNAVAQEWENPCVALDRVPDPRALAVNGIWDASGARRDVPGKVTFACENGAITKCIQWGYKPWASHEGQSLTDFHQACTRMARADYCGNGRSHTHEDTVIDMYDRLGRIERATEVSADWDPARGSFEAAWAPDGATCLGHTRDGRAMESILQECPNRFSTGSMTDLGQGDRCVVQRTDVSPGTALLRNRSYGAPAGATSRGKK
jgi:hypothetical protein